MAETVLYQFCGAGEMPGGVQDSTNSIAGFMRGQGLDTHILIGSSEDVEKTADVFDAFKPDNIHILGSANHYTVANGSQNPLGSLINPWRMNSTIKEVNPDVFHINAPWMPHVGGIALRLAQKHDIPTVSTYHIVSDERVTNVALKISGRVDRTSIHGLDAMIAVSEPARRHMEKTYKFPGEVKIIPNGVDIESLEQSKSFEANEPFEGYDPSRPTIVFVGRPDPRKGLDELVKTFKLLHRDMPDAQLIVCGGKNPYAKVASDASLTPFIALTEELGIDKAVHFMGRVSDSDKGRWFASADIAALPATGNESQGIVLLEAMAAGAGVVVGGNNEGYASVFNSTDVLDSDLMLVKPQHIQEFKERLRLLLESDYLAIDLHIEQQKLVRRKYDIQLVGRQIQELYKSLI